MKVISIIYSHPCWGLTLNFVNSEIMDLVRTETNVPALRDVRDSILASLGDEIMALVVNAAMSARRQRFSP